MHNIQKKKNCGCVHIQICIRIEWGLLWSWNGQVRASSPQTSQSRSLPTGPVTDLGHTRWVSAVRVRVPLTDKQNILSLAARGEAMRLERRRRLHLSAILKVGSAVIFTVISVTWLHLMEPHSQPFTIWSNFFKILLTLRNKMLVCWGGDSFSHLC